MDSGPRDGKTKVPRRVALPPCDTCNLRIYIVPCPSDTNNEDDEINEADGYSEWISISIVSDWIGFTSSKILYINGCILS